MYCVKYPNVLNDGYNVGSWNNTILTRIQTLKVKEAQLKNDKLYWTMLKSWACISIYACLSTYI